MLKPSLNWTDEQVEQGLGLLLRGGVILAAAIVFMGGIVYLIRYGATIPNYHLFRGEPADLRSVSGIIKDVFSFRSRGLIQFGFLLLIATPVARVVFSIVAFALQGDRLYAIITLLVLAVLIYSLAGGSL